MENKTTKGKSNIATLAFLGASLAGVAATTYFFFGPKGKKNQKQAKAWVIKMKGDIVEKLEMAREISEPVYHQIIDSVAAKYEKGAKASHEEISMLAQDLKKNWKTIISSVKVIKNDVLKGKKKVIKKTKSKV
ncbi:MAG: hypothetical protein WC319_02895 [Candidatus Paceibacterota bacterium]|jgi:cbb3-type cytochrome oxidase subunit 3